MTRKAGEKATGGGSRIGIEILQKFAIRNAGNSDEGDWVRESKRAVLVKAALEGAVRWRATGPTRRIVRLLDCDPEL